MSTYVNFTEEEIYRAAHTDIKTLLEAKGEKVIPSGSEWMWAEHNSVKIRGNVFYQHSTGDHGTAIDFMCLFFNMRFPDAVATLIHKDYDGVELRRVDKVEKKKIPFALPPRNKNMHRAYAYLMQERHIDSDIISFFVHNRSIYESQEPVKNSTWVSHNVVFVGFDVNGTAKAAHVKGTLTQKPYRKDVDGSHKDYFFNYAGESNLVYVFEAPIDLLSFITLHKQCDWTRHNFIALGGVADRALLRFLLEHPDIDHVALCLDNDARGQKADNDLAYTLNLLKEGRKVENLKRLEPPDSDAQEKLKRNFVVSILKSNRKDWNDDLKLISLGGYQK